MELTTLKNTLATDKQCREYLADIRWKDGFVCPHCGNSEAWKTEDIKYKCKKCGHRISVTSGTVFQDSHTPLNKWFLGIWLVSEYGKKITADMLQKELELGSNRTALSILGKLRKASAIKTADKLANTVEVKKEFIIFHGQKFFILTAVEVIGSSIGQIRIQKADHNNKEQITEFIRNNIMPYDLVVTDLSPEQKKKKVGIVTPLPIQREIEADYNRIVKSPMYTYRFTGKVRNDFTVWANNKCPKDKFEQGCKRYCMQHNGKYVHITFEELLENLLKLKKQKKGNTAK